jgi:uncharacterized tellurite resistance protein B-like protein
MLNKLKNFFNQEISPGPDRQPADLDRRIQVATCALLIEMASIDEEFEPAEKMRIADFFRKAYAMSQQAIDELMEIAGEELDTKIDLWGFSNLINQHYALEQKLKIMEIIWEVIYADGQLTAHEDYLVHKLYKMFDLTHAQMIEAKMKVLERRRRR